MPEVLERLIKAHYSQNQLKQREEAVESPRVHRVQAAVSAAAAAAGAGAGASEASDGNATSSGSEFPVALAPRLSSSVSSSSTLSFHHPRSISRRRQHQTPSGPGGAEDELLAGNSGLDSVEATPVVDLWQDLSTVQSNRTGGSGGGGGCGQRQRGQRGRLYTDELVLPHWAPEVAEIARHRVEEGDIFHAVAICEVVR